MDRKKQEILHGKAISLDAENIWGWTTPAGNLRGERRVDEILKRLGLDNKLKILEIGCGTGFFSSKFKKRGIEPICLDISMDLLNHAKNKGSNLNFIQADAENLPFKDNTFDAIIVISVLHHLDIKVALTAFKNALKKDGLIIFSEPNMLNPQIFLQKNIPFLKKMAGDTPTETAFFRWSLKKPLKKLGFSRIEIKPFDFMHPAIPIGLISLFKPITELFEKIPVIKELSGSLIIFAKK